MLFRDEIRIDYIYDDFLTYITTDEEYEKIYCMKQGEEFHTIDIPKLLRMIAKRMSYEEFKTEFKKYLIERINTYYWIGKYEQESHFYITNTGETEYTYDEYLEIKLKEYEDLYEKYDKEYWNE